MLTGIIADLAALSTEYVPQIFLFVGGLLVLVAAFALARWIQKRVKSAIK